ncbi:unnamed protein product [Vitrella brassicaformis CCMP3155]|uniref:EGF-like domain-containing protein n=2 Tax=Vitrella brassicaformis TaxID=1169539 RepID=A0A0G4FM98_VITBC|nr:unnamed protein product [Vitrella brassicaformis CCMP3155]|eukprot:CEM14970.1 unnamed protein product [Vitrella brassicaformis CCMP3155]
MSYLFVSYKKTEYHDNGDINRQLGAPSFSWTAMEELPSCAACQVDADALFEVGHESGLADFEAEFDAKTRRNICELSFVVCVRVTEDAVEGYILMLVGDSATVLLSGVPVWVMLLGGSSVPLPSTLFDLTAVLGLVILSTPFEGVIDDRLGNLTSLRLLQLEDNQYLTGALGHSIGRLQNLRVLSISGGNVAEPSSSYRFHGDIPSTLFALPHLQSLIIQFTQLRLLSSGDDWCPEGGAQLRVVDLSSNPYLLKAFPTGPLSCSRLKFLFLRGLQLEGPLPESINRLSSLEILDVPRNAMTGPLPFTLGDLKELRFLNLGKNMFDFLLPVSFGLKWRNLRVFYAEENQLSGMLPWALGFATELRHLSLQRQFLTGPIPASFSNLSELRAVWLNDNMLTGELPDLSKWTKVENMDIANNQLSGSLDPLTKLQAVHTLRIFNNQFEGQIPQELVSLRELVTLNARDNRLSGLPHSLDGWPKLVYANLARNQLQGFIPLMENLTSLESLSFVSNRLEGFEGDGRLPSRLKQLWLGGNQFSRLPEGWHTLPARLEFIQLSYNEIGVWPDWGRTALGHDLCNKLRIGNEETALTLVRHQRPPNWPALQILDVSHNPLNVNVNFFLSTLKWHPRLREIECQDCGVKGPMGCEAYVTYDYDQVVALSNKTRGDISFDDQVETFSGFLALEALNLASNPLKALQTSYDPRVSFPKSTSVLQRLDVRNASLTAVEPLEWFAVDTGDFTDNPQLQLSVPPASNITSCAELSEGAADSIERYLQPDPNAFAPKRDDISQQMLPHECTRLCRTFNVLQVDEALNVTSLCRCIDGHEGRGKLCTPCRRNTFSNRRSGTEQCTPCPHGSESSPASAACHCKLGYEADDKADDTEELSCRACEAGTYGKLSGGIATCVSCGGPRFTSLPKTTSRDHCLCIEKYILNRHSFQCEDCMAYEGLNCSLPLRPSSVTVKRGFFLLTVQIMESIMPRVSVDRELPRRRLASAAIRSTYAANITSLPIAVECPYGPACNPYGTDPVNQCTEGHAGFVCGLCESGFARSTPLAPCRPCAAGWQNVLSNLALLAVSIGAIFLLTHLSKRAASALHVGLISVILKITIGHFTVMSGLMALDYAVLRGDTTSQTALPSVYRGLFGWDGGISMEYTSWTCLFASLVGDETAELWRHAVWIGLPIILLVVVTLFAELWMVASGRRHRDIRASSVSESLFDLTKRATSQQLPGGKGDHSSEDDRAFSHATRSHTADESETASRSLDRTQTRASTNATRETTKSHPTDAQSREKRRGLLGFVDRHATLWIVTLNLCFPTATRNFLSLLRCRDYPFVQESFTADEIAMQGLLQPTDLPHLRRLDLKPDVFCDVRSTTYLPFLIIAVIGLFAWVVLPIASGLVVLVRHYRKGELHLPSVRERYGFLTKSYRQNFFFWEATVAFRRVFVLVVASVAITQARVQLTAWSLLAVTALVVQLRLQPFRRDRRNLLNRIEERGLAVWLLSVILMQFAFGGVLSDTGHLAVLTVVILMSLLHYVSILVTILSLWLQQTARDYQEKEDFKLLYLLPKSRLRWLGPFVDWLSADTTSVSLQYEKGLSMGPQKTASCGQRLWSLLRRRGRPRTALELTSEAMKEALDVLKPTTVPPDFLNFLYAHACVSYALRDSDSCHIVLNDDATSAATVTIPIEDFQLHLSSVVEELIGREERHGEGPHKSEGWVELYVLYRGVKKALKSSAALEAADLSNDEVALPHLMASAAVRLSKEMTASSDRASADSLATASASSDEWIAYINRVYQSMPSIVGAQAELLLGGEGGKAEAKEGEELSLEGSARPIPPSADVTLISQCVTFVRE